jgi:hypothetical protein
MEIIQANGLELQLIAISTGMQEIYLKINDSTIYLNFRPIQGCKKYIAISGLAQNNAMAQNFD